MPPSPSMAVFLKWQRVVPIRRLGFYCNECDDRRRRAAGRCNGLGSHDGTEAPVGAAAPIATAAPIAAAAAILGHRQVDLAAIDARAALDARAAIDARAALAPAGLYSGHGTLHWAFLGRGHAVRRLEPEPPTEEEHRCPQPEAEEGSRQEPPDGVEGRLRRAHRGIRGQLTGVDAEEQVFFR